MIPVDTPPPILFYITCIYLKYKGDYGRNGTEEFLSMKWNKVEQIMRITHFLLFSKNNYIELSRSANNKSHYCQLFGASCIPTTSM